MEKTFYVGVKGVVVKDDKVLLLQKAGGGGMSAQDYLNEYSDNLAGIDYLNARKQAKIDEVLTPEIKERLIEFGNMLASVSLLEGLVEVEDWKELTAEWEDEK